MFDKILLVSPRDFIAKMARKSSLSFAIHSFFSTFPILRLQRRIFVGTVESAPRTSGSKSRIHFFIFALNLILLVALLYKTYGRALTPSGGVSVAIFNDTLSPMIDLSVTYPGGKLNLARLGAGERVGQPIANVKEFDATLTFKDEEGHTFSETVHIKPLDELLILIDVLPVLDPSTVTTADGKEQKVLRASISKVRIITSYQGPVLYN